MKYVDIKIDNSTEDIGRLFAAEFNTFAQEQLNLVGKFFSYDGNSTSQLIQATDVLSKAMFYADSGTANNVVLTRANTEVNKTLNVETFYDGMTLFFKPSNANTGAFTIKVGDLVAKPAKYRGSDPVSGFLSTTEFYTAIYDKSGGVFNVFQFSFPAADYTTKASYDALVATVNGIASTVATHTTEIATLVSETDLNTSDIADIVIELSNIDAALTARYTKDETDVLNALMSESEFFANANANKEQFASSGVVEFGTGYPTLNVKGLWSATTGNIYYEDNLRWGRQSTTFDPSVANDLSHAPIVNVAGHLIKVTSEHEGGDINPMRLDHTPDLPIIVTDPDNLPSDVDFGDFVYVDNNKNTKNTPIAIWDFENNNGKSGLTLHGGTITTGGKYGKKLVLNGANEFGTINDKISSILSGVLTNKYAVSFWIYRNSGTSGDEEDIFYLAGENWYVGMAPYVKFSFNKVGDTATLDVGALGAAYAYDSINVADSGEGWKHVLYYLDLDNNTAHLYFNGSYVGSVTHAGIGALGGTVPFTLGKAYMEALSSVDFGGMHVDDIRIIPGEIDQDDVDVIYAQAGWIYGNKTDLVPDGSFSSGVDASFSVDGGTTLQHNPGDYTAVMTYNDNVSAPYLMFTSPTPIFSNTEYYMTMKITSPSGHNVSPYLTLKNSTEAQSAFTKVAFLDLGDGVYAFNIKASLETSKFYIYPDDISYSVDTAIYKFDDVHIYAKNGLKLSVIKEGGLSAGDSINQYEVAHGVEDFSRKFFFMLETRIEDIADTDNWVMPYGNAAYANDNIPGLTGLTSLGFTDSDTYSKQGYWEINNSESVGRGYDWDILSKDQKIAFAKFPWNNMFISGSSIKQLRWVLRSIRLPNSIFDKYDYREADSLGTGEIIAGKSFFNTISRRSGAVTLTNDFSNGTASKTFRSMLQSDGNVSNYREDIGIYAACCKTEDYNFGMPLALVQRRNSGIYHPTLNPNGTGKVFVSDTSSISTSDAAGIGLVKTLKDCFDPNKMAVVSLASPDDDVATYQDYLDGIVSQSNYALSGSMESNRSGRPDGQYFNKIYEDDIDDLRLDAKRYSKDDMLKKHLKDFETGSLRGKESVPSAISVEHVIYSGSVLYIRPYNNLGYMSLGLPTLGLLEDVKVLYKGDLYLVDIYMTQNMYISGFNSTDLYTTFVNDEMALGTWRNLYLNCPIQIIDERFYTTYRKAFKTTEFTSTGLMNMCDIFYPYNKTVSNYLINILSSKTNMYTPNLKDNNGVPHLLSTLPYIETTFDTTTARTVELPLVSKVYGTPYKVVITNIITGERIDDSMTLLIKTSSGGLDNPGIYALNQTTQTCWVNLDGDQKDSNINNTLYVVIGGSSVSSGFSSIITSDNLDEWSIEVYYKTHTNPTLIRDINTNQETISNILAVNTSNMNKGGAVLSALLGKAPVGSSNIEMVRSDNGLSGEIGIEPGITGTIVHEEFNNIDDAKDMVKVLPYLGNDNNKAVLGLLYKEMKYSSGVESTDVATIIDGISDGTILSKVASTTTTGGINLVAVAIENLGVFIFSDTKGELELVDSIYKYQEFLTNPIWGPTTEMMVIMASDLTDVMGHTHTGSDLIYKTSPYLGGYAEFNGTSSSIALDSAVTTALASTTKATVFFTMLRTSLTNTSDTKDAHIFALTDGTDGQTCKNKIYVEMNYNNENKVRVLFGDLVSDYTSIVINIGSELRAYDFAICVDLDAETPVIYTFIDGFLRGVTDITSTTPAAFSNMTHINYGLPTGLGSGATYAMYAGGSLKNIRIESVYVPNEAALKAWTDNGIPGFGINIDMNNNKLVIGSYKNFMLMTKNNSNVTYGLGSYRISMLDNDTSIVVSDKATKVGEKLIHIAGLTDDRYFIDANASSLKELTYDGLSSFNITADTDIGKTIVNADANDVNIMLLDSSSTITHFTKYLTETDFTERSSFDSFVHYSSIIYGFFMNSQYFAILYVDVLNSNRFKIKLMTYDSIGVGTEHISIVIDSNVTLVTNDMFSLSANGNIFYITGNDGVGTELRRVVVEKTLLDNGSLSDVFVGSHGDDEAFIVSNGVFTSEDDHGNSVINGHRIIELKQLVERKG